jgi:hypothetical protein
LNSIKFHLNLKFWKLETIFYIPLTVLVKYPATSLLFSSWPNVLAHSHRSLARLLR